MAFIIHFDATTEELEKALPFTKGKWKPYSTPLFNQEDLKPGKMGKFEGKFEFAQPYPPSKNYLNMSDEELEKIDIKKL